MNNLFELDFGRWEIYPLFLIPAFINLGLFIYTLFFLPNDKINYSFSMFVLVASLWQATEGLTRLSITAEVAGHWASIGGVFAVFMTPFGILFTTSFFDWKNKISQQLLFLTQFIPAILAAFLIITGSQGNKIIPSDDWYWILQTSTSVGNQMIYAWIGVSGLLTMALLWRNWFKIRKKRDKGAKYSLLVAIGYTTPFIGGTIAEMAFPLLGMKDYPITTSLFTCFSIASLVAILKRDLFEYSPKHQWEQIVETMNEGIIIVDNHDRIMYANKVFCNTLGYEHGELRGMLASQFFLNGDSGKPLRDILSNGQSKQCELKLRSGDIKWMVLSGSPATDSKGRTMGFMGLFTNISKLKQAEQIVVSGRERLELAIEAGKMITLDYDFSSGLVSLSDNAMSLMGIAPEIKDMQELVKQHIHPDDRAMVKSSLASTVSGRVQDLQFRFVRPDTGEIIWIERRGEITHGQDGKLIGMRGILMDITQRKATEHKLFRNTERLKAIFANEPECVTVVSVLGKLEDINPAGLEMLEVADMSDVIQKDFQNFIHAEDRALYADFHAKVSGGEHGSCDFRTVGIMGTERWMESNAVPLKNAEGKIYAVLSVCRDITEIKKKADEIIRVKEVLEKSEKGLKEAQKMARMGSWEYDLQTAQIFWSEEMFNILGLDPSVHSASPEIFMSCIHPDDVELVTQVTNEGEKALKDYSFRCRIVLKDGAVRHIFVDCRFEFDADGITQNIYGIVHDITEQMQGAIKLQQSQRRLVQAQEIAHVGNWEVNFATNTSIWSDESYRIYGFEPGEHNFTYEDWLSFIHPDDLDEVNRQIKEAGKTLSNSSMEHRIVRPDGTIRYINSVSRYEFDSTGKPIGLVGVVHDITETKTNEIKLQKLLALTNNQNKRLKNFAYIVSHNIRSHSANISGLVDLFAGETSDNPEFRMLKSSSDKLSETILNLNTIITMQNETCNEKVPVGLRAEVLKTLDAINTSIAKSDARVTVEVRDEETIDIVPSYLESILLNLLTNAVKYRSHDRRLEISINTEYAGDYLILNVKDNGLGIDMDRFGNNLFGMYKTFHNNEDAKGLGLFIVKNQVEAMNGKIEVQSQPGKGTTFSIFFYINEPAIENILLDYDQKVAV